MRSRALFLGFFIFGFVAFVFAQPDDPQEIIFYKSFLPPSISEHAGAVDRLFFFILGVTGFFLIATQACLFWFVIRYRESRQLAPDLQAVRPWKKWGWFLMVSALLFVMALGSNGLWGQLKRVPPDRAETLKIRIQAEQYAWNVQYPGNDRRFDTDDDIWTINQLSVPIDTPVRVTLKSIEREGKPAVIHSFFLPELRLKQDVVPGMPVDVWFKAQTLGRYEIACAEYCGFGHYSMRGIFEVKTKDDFKDWLADTSKGTL